MTGLHDPILRTYHDHRASSKRLVSKKLWWSFISEPSLAAFKPSRARFDFLSTFEPTAVTLRNQPCVSYQRRFPSPVSTTSFLEHCLELTFLSDYLGLNAALFEWADSYDAKVRQPPFYTLPNADLSSHRTGHASANALLLPCASITAPS